MPTRRRELLCSLVAHVRQALGTRIPVSGAPTFAWGEQQLPQVSITADTEILVTLSAWPRVYRRTLALRVSCLLGLRSGQDLADELERSLQDLEDVAHAWSPEGVHHVLVTQEDTDVFLEGRLQCGAALLSLEVIYDTEEPTFDPQDELARVHVEEA